MDEPTHPSETFSLMGHIAINQPRMIYLFLTSTRAKLRERNFKPWEDSIEGK
jgi:hypothetical protein